MSDAELAVDVVIPVRNGARYIASCLDSVSAQTMTVTNVIVVDDGSTDDTAEIVEGYVRRWPALRLVRTCQRGLPHARNTGVANCRSPYVAFLDSDDVWEASKLERQMRLFSLASARVGLIYCSYYHIDEAGQRIESCRIVEPQRRVDLLHDLLVERNIISGSGSAAVVRREFLERTGGFDEKLTFGEDWDLWLRLAEISEFDFVPDALVGIRLHHDSMQGGAVSLKNERFLCQTLRILDRWYKTPVFPAQLHGEYRRLVIHFAMLAAASQPASRRRRQLEFYREIKCRTGDFGRDLFSGPLEFFATLYGTVLKLRVRSALNKVAMSILPPPYYQGLRRFILHRGLER